MRPEPASALLADLPISLGDALRAAAADVQDQPFIRMASGEWRYGRLAQLSEGQPPRVRHQIPFSPVFDPSTLTKSST